MAAIAADEEVSLCLRTVLKTGDCRVGGGGLEVPAEPRQLPLDHPPMSSQPLVSTPRLAMRAFILRLRRALRQRESSSPCQRGASRTSCVGGPSPGA